MKRQMEIYTRIKQEISNYSTLLGLINYKLYDYDEFQLEVVDQIVTELSNNNQELKELINSLTYDK